MHVSKKRMLKIVIGIFLTLVISSIVAVCAWTFRAAPLETFTQDALFAVPYLEGDRGFYAIPDDDQAQIIAALRDCTVRRELVSMGYEATRGNNIYSCFFYSADSAAGLGELMIAEGTPAKIYIRASNMEMHGYTLTGDQDLSSLLPLFQALEASQTPQNGASYSSTARD